MRQMLYRVCHSDTTTSGSEAESDVTRAIIESIGYNRRYNFGWNEAVYQFYTEQDMARYDLPRDFVTMAGEVFYSSTSDGSVLSKRPMKWRSLEWVESNKFVITDGNEYLDSGVPYFYAIDPKGKRLVLSPTPSTTNDLIEFSYIRDPGTPRFKYTGSAWAFYLPDSDDAISATFTNEWFNEGFYLIFNRAAFILWSREMGGTEEATIRAQEHLKLWADELARLRAETARLVSGKEIVRHI